MMEKQNACFGELSLEIEIGAPIDVVWPSLVDKIGDWWPAEFYAGGVEGERSFSLECFPGGRMYEEWESGGGLLWGTVIAVEPPVKLQVVGYGFPEWGGPGTWFGTWDLEEKDSSTVLRFSESTVGRVSDAGIESKTKGWRYLFDGVLKAYVEKTPIPPWTD